MKLATTIGDFSKYSTDQEVIVKYLNQCGFRYIDYNIGLKNKYKNFRLFVERRKFLYYLKLELFKIFLQENLQSLAVSCLATVPKFNTQHRERNALCFFMPKTKIE